MKPGGEWKDGFKKDPIGELTYFFFVDAFPEGRQLVEKILDKFHLAKDRELQEQLATLEQVQSYIDRIMK